MRSGEIPVLAVAVALVVVCPRKPSYLLTIRHPERSEWTTVLAFAFAAAFAVVLACLRLHPDPEQSRRGRSFVFAFAGALAVTVALLLLFFHLARIRFCAPLRCRSKRQRRDDITAQPEGLG